MTGFPNRGIRRNSEEWEYEPDPMGRLGQGRWVPKQARDPFGRLSADLPSGADEDDPEVGPLDLLAPVGPDQWNLSGDVERVEGMLMRTGHLAPDPIVTGRGEFMARQEQAIKSFQRDHGLRQDGLINPSGPTYETLVASLERMNDAGGSAYGDVGDKPELRGGAESDQAQVAAVPAVLPLIPIAMQGAAALLGKILLGISLIGTVLSLSGDTPKDESTEDSIEDGDGHGGRSLEGKDDRAHAEALRERAIDLFFKPFYESRGDAYTEKGNSIAVRACEKVMSEEFPDLKGRLVHTHGATKNGKGQIKLKEAVIPGPDSEQPKLGSVRPDLTYEYLDEISDAAAEGNDESKKRRLLVNTVDVLKDGTTPTARERKALEKMPALGGWIVRHMPKLRPGMDEAEYEAMVTEKCREFFRDVREKAKEGKREG
jgi:hypothetical protein